VIAAGREEHPDTEGAAMNIQKTLIVIGLVILVFGLFFPVISKLPLGRLPGDIIIDRPGIKVYFPITTMIVISLIISLVSWFFRR
jgi:hypothetical protein